MDHRFLPCMHSLPKMRYKQLVHTRKDQDEMPQNTAKSKEGMHIFFIIISLFFDIYDQLPTSPTLYIEID